MPHFIQKFIALLLAIILLPLLIVLLIVTWLETKEIPIFSQERIGYNNKVFLMYKIRSVKTDQIIPYWPTEYKPFRTKIGKILRRFWLDESPQLFNVIKGDMNLVGPRPEMRIFSNYFDNYLKSYSMRRQVLPGITGLSQVLGYRNNTSIDERLHFDLKYIAERNLFLDIKILFMTLIEIITSSHYKNMPRNPAGYAEEINKKVIENYNNANNI